MVRVQVLSFYVWLLLVLALVTVQASDPELYQRFVHFEKL